MSVFTPVTPEQIRNWLGGYAVGRLIELRGIEAGVQNSNFFVTTTLGRYVLTLFESVPRAELPFYLHLMAHLARHGLPVPAPIATRDNDYLGTLAGRPAVMVARLAGRSEMAPTVAHCERLGAMLAGLHLAGVSYGRRQENSRGPAWRERTAAAVRPQLAPGDRALLDAELVVQRSLYAIELPQGTIHADLFRDNVLWDGEHVGGVIDFYFACSDTLLLDVAITLNDWCGRADGTLDPARAKAFLLAYHADRPFTRAEREAWPTMLRRAALRFWLSRLEDFHRPREGEMVLVKNPDEFREILRVRIAQPDVVQLP
jgi:homoserine kinase type II